MIDRERVNAHRERLENYSAVGRPLDVASPRATVRAGKWFAPNGMPLAGRRQLHRKILSEFVAGRPQIAQGRKAIVLAGPPGAGKSTVRDSLVEQTEIPMPHWLVLNADDFKDEVLLVSMSDGSYGEQIVPPEIGSLEAEGERFYPRELAALVHEESSILVKSATADAIARGDNVIIDGTLGNLEKARTLLLQLSEASYDVAIASIETQESVSQLRVRCRWEEGYVAAEDGTAEGLDAKLGGRWVPPSFVSSLYTDPEASESVCAESAATVAAEFGCVNLYQRFLVEDVSSSPQLVESQVRSSPTAALGE